MTYDVLDRLISMTTEQSVTTGQHYQWTYDPHNLIKNMTAPNGSLVSYTYDHNDNVVSQTITDGTTSKVYQYAYNVNGELVSATAPNGSQSQRIRDGLGRVVEMRD